jgi:hypothetical protein
MNHQVGSQQDKKSKMGMLWDADSGTKKHEDFGGRVQVLVRTKSKGNTSTDGTIQSPFYVGGKESWGCPSHKLQGGANVDTSLLLNS